MSFQIHQNKSEVFNSQLVNGNDVQSMQLCAVDMCRAKDEVVYAMHPGVKLLSQKYIM